MTVGTAVLVEEGMMSSNRGRTERILDASNAPYFAKTLTRSMLRRTERLEIPKWFLAEHGDRLHKVLSLTGPNGRSQPVKLRMRSSFTRPRESPRFFLSHGWKAFAVENGFQMGDKVVFCLVASASFHLLLSSPKLRTSKADEDAVTCSELPPQHTNHEEIPVNSNSEMSIEVVPSHRPTSNVREEEYVNYPGLDSAVTANSRFPQFVKRLTPNNLHGKHSIRLELPFNFVKEHEDELQEHVALLGASGHLRVVSLKITTFFEQSRVHLSKGWKDFSLENEFSEGDVLLFSLVGLSTFVVKTFSKRK